MLLYLHEQLADDLDSLSSMEWNALEMLAHAALEGKHHVLLNRKLCSRILDHSSQFSLRSLSFYRHNKANASTNSLSLISQACVYGMILRNPSIPVRLPDSKNALLFSLDYFSRTDSVQPFVFA